MGGQTHRLVAPVDAHQEEGLGDEEADAQVLVDGVAVALEAAEEAEGEEADEQADQREQDSHPGDDVQQHVVNGIRVLPGFRKQRKESKAEFHSVQRRTACVRRAEKTTFWFPRAAVL